MNKLYNPYNAILERYAAARDAAADGAEKEEVDNKSREITSAKNRLCALMGGKRRLARSHRHRRSYSSRVLKRTRKHRR